MSCAPLVEERKGGVVVSRGRHGRKVRIGGGYCSKSSMIMQYEMWKGKQGRHVDCGTALVCLQGTPAMSQSTCCYFFCP